MTDVLVLRELLNQRPFHKTLSQNLLRREHNLQHYTESYSVPPYPGCDIVLKFCKMLPLGLDDGARLRIKETTKNLYTYIFEFVCKMS
ncbi:hypothetical protein AAY473_021852 [Plecturocebus cupreus]